MGFFTPSQLKKQSAVKVDIDQLESNCLGCGLYKHSSHPKIKVSGEGRKRILIIGEYSTDSDDQYGTAFAGDEGEYLRRTLKFENVSLNLDCWKINAVRCKNQTFGKNPTQIQINACRPYIEKIVKQLKPKLILVMGDIAITSLFGEDFSNRTTTRWRGYCIPDEKFKCNIVPLYPPSHVLRFEKDKNLKTTFERDLKSAIRCLETAEFEWKDYEQYVTPIKDFNRVVTLLKRILKRKAKIAYDYETTGLKPFKQGHKIVSIGVAVTPTKAFAFPYQWKSFWTKSEFLEIKRLWKAILADKEIEKIAQNCFSGDTKYITKEGMKSFVETEDTKQLVWAKKGWEEAEIKCFGEDYLSEIIVGPADRSRSSIKRKIYSTENHRWIILRRFQRNKKSAVFKEIEATTKQLKLRDKILCKLPKFIVNKNTEAFRHGLIFADGSKTSRATARNIQAFMIRLCGKKEKYKDCFPKYTYPPSSKGDPVVNWYKTSFDMKKMPENPSAEYVANFIEGWNAGDGTNSTAGNSRVITTFNKDAAYWLQENAALGGWVCTGCSEHIQKPNNFCKKENKPYWMIVITQEKVAWSVKSIEHKVKKEKVYCVSLPKEEFTLQYGIYTRNSKFEETWGSVFFNERHGWHFDTMMCAHILDNRSSSTGLKFQTFVNYGVRSYDKDIAPLLKSVDGEFNRIEKAPLNDLLVYNGLDCIFAWMRYEDQIVEITKRRGLLSAYNFFMEGNKQMATIQLNGIHMDSEYYIKAEKYLLEEVAKRKKYLEEGREARAFKKKFGRPILLTSNQDLGKLFYEVLGKEPIYTGSGNNYKTDKSTLESLNLPFVKKLAEMKKYEKARGTYLGQFAREICGDKMYPFYDLNIPITYRSSSSKPNFQNLPARDAEIKKLIRAGIVPDFGCVLSEIDFCLVGKTLIETNEGPKTIKQIIKRIKTHKVSVLCYQHDNKRMGFGKVIDGKPTRKNAKLLLITLDNKEEIKGTPDHKFMLRDGSYKEASKLATSDSLMPLYKKAIKSGDGIYWSIKLNTNQRHDTELEHRLLAKDIFNINLGRKKGDLITHHKDGNGLNNKESNLDFISRNEHMEIHTKQGWKNKPIGIRKNRDILELSSLAKRINKERKESWTKDDWNNFSKKVSKGIQEKNNGNKGKNNSMYGKHHSKETRSKIKIALANRYKHKKEICKICGKEYKKIGAHIKVHNITWYKYQKDYNHKIISIKNINNREDTYNITVEKYHNFALSAGVVVKNSGAEVITSATCHKDKNFIAYLLDKTTDMHRDNATDLLKLPHDMLENIANYSLDQKTAIKKIRFFAKNNWTFAQFYGDWFGSCAPIFWENVIEAGLKLPNSMTCREWLENKGIYELGKMTKKGPEEGTFIEHCKKVEDKMWNKRFPEYTQWKKDIVEFYQTYGFIENHFGFRFTGYMSKNQCSNFPIQSASFHLLVYTLIQIQKFIDENKLKTKVVGQIHDSVVSQIPKDEIKIYTKGVSDIVGGLQDKFDWLIIPMEVEIELSKLRENGGNFSKLREFSMEEIEKEKYLKFIRKHE
jgi:uracil-DNA glycosylase family 4